MTDKPAVWFTEASLSSWWHKGGNFQCLLSALGRVIYTTARIKGKETMVRIRIP